MTPSFGAMPSDPVAPADQALERLAQFVARASRLFVLTGAGCSTDSGIPAYRDAEGCWCHRPPVQYTHFVREAAVRQRYWARSLIGWHRFSGAQPNPAHRALAELEAAGFIHQLVTQNVDGLHQKAGSTKVIDLHGRLDEVECLSCAGRLPRADVQCVLERDNPDFTGLQAPHKPDGDVDLEGIDFGGFRAPSCPHCGGILKPAVVFFGECIPPTRVEQALARLAEADAVLVIGSSLMVYSGYRFCQAAAEQHKPIAAINLGRTRADDLLALKVAESCSSVLPRLAHEFASRLAS